MLIPPKTPWIAYAHANAEHDFLIENDPAYLAEYRTYYEELMGIDDDDLDLDDDGDFDDDDDDFDDDDDEEDDINDEDLDDDDYDDD